MNKLNFLLPLTLSIILLSSCNSSSPDLTAEKDLSLKCSEKPPSSSQSKPDSTIQSQYNYFWDKPSDNTIIPFSGYLKKAQLKMQHEIDIRNLSISEDDFSKLFSLISKATEVPYPKSFLDGYKLMLEYESENKQSISIQLHGFNDGQTIYADIKDTNGNSLLENSSNCFQSAELVTFIQSMVSWKEFDVQNLSGINEISVQTMFGIQKSDTATIISGKDAESITNSIMKNSKRQAAGNCGYNIKVIFKKTDGTEYHALLAGDSCPDIAIEGCVFRIDPEIIKMIYKKINYDMSVGN